MSQPEQPHDTGALPATTSTPVRRRRLVGVIALVTALALGGIWLLSLDRGPDASSSQNATSTSTPTAPGRSPSSGGADSSTPSPSTSPSPSASAARSPSPSPSATTPATTSSASATTSSASARPSTRTSAPITTNEPVDLDETADFGDGVVATLSGMTAIEGQAQGIGEVAGPALRFTVEIRNGTDQPLTLDYAVVDLAYGADNTPGIPLLGDPSSRPLSGSVAPGATAQGVYVFAVPIEGRGSVTVTVSHEALSPIVVFTGAAPR